MAHMPLVKQNNMHRSKEDLKSIKSKSLTTVLNVNLNQLSAIAKKFLPSSQYGIWFKNGTIFVFFSGLSSY